MANRFILNETSYHGAGAIKEVVTEVKARGLKKGLVVTDKDLIKFGVATKVTDLLDEAGLPYEMRLRQTQLLNKLKMVYRQLKMLVQTI